METPDCCQYCRRYHRYQPQVPLPRYDEDIVDFLANFAVNDIPPYFHKPLTEAPEGHFTTRLIRILPWPSEEGLIQCSMLEAYIPLMGYEAGEYVNYQALSYCWGSAENQQDILIDGRSITIRENLWDYLNMIRKIPDVQDYGYWIDSLCIDQRDLRERSKQVQNMGSVYHRARRVEVWLGQGNKGIEDGLGILSHYGVSLQSNPIMLSDESVNKVCLQRKCTPSQYWAWVLAQICSSHSIEYGDFRNNMQQVVDLPYWRRMWIVQELYHAKDIIVWYGEYFVHFDYICGLMGVAQDLPSAARLLSELMSTSVQSASFHRELKKLCGTIRAPVKNAPATRETTLGELLDSFSSSNCADTKDRVYALRSMILWSDQLQVDYTEGLTDFLVRLLPLLHQEKPTAQQLFKTWQILVRGLNLHTEDLNDLVNTLSYLSQDENRHEPHEEEKFRESFQYLLNQRIILEAPVSTWSKNSSENSGSACSLCDCWIDPPFNEMNPRKYYCFQAAGFTGSLQTCHLLLGSRPDDTASSPEKDIAFFQVRVLQGTLPHAEILSTGQSELSLDVRTCMTLTLFAEMADRISTSYEEGVRCSTAWKDMMKRLVTMGEPWCPDKPADLRYSRFRVTGGETSADENWRDYAEALNHDARVTHDRRRSKTQEDDRDAARPVSSNQENMQQNIAGLLDTLYNNQRSELLMAQHEDARQQLELGT